MYNRERGHFTCRIEKRTPGEEFAGLDSILANTRNEFEMNGMEDDMLRESREEEAKERTRHEEAMRGSRHGYGFCARYKDVFRGKEKLLGEACDFNPLDVARAYLI